MSDKDMTKKGRKTIQKEADRITFRLPTTLRDLMYQYIMIDTHLNESDFIRSAIREKINREAPQLRNELFEGA